MPTATAGQRRSEARSGAEESEIGHPSAGLGLRRRGRKVSRVSSFLF